VRGERRERRANRRPPCGPGGRGSREGAGGGAGGATERRANRRPPCGPGGRGSREGAEGRCGGSDGRGGRAEAARRGVKRRSFLLCASFALSRVHPPWLPSFTGAPPLRVTPPSASLRLCASPPSRLARWRARRLRHLRPVLPVTPTCRSPLPLHLPAPPREPAFEAPRWLAMRLATPSRRAPSWLCARQSGGRRGWTAAGRVRRMAAFLSMEPLWVADE